MKITNYLKKCADRVRSLLLVVYFKNRKQPAAPTFLTIMAMRDFLNLFIKYVTFTHRKLTDYSCPDYKSYIFIIDSIKFKFIQPKSLTSVCNQPNIK